MSLTGVAPQGTAGFAAIAEAVWTASTQQRRAQFHSWSRCPTRKAPYGIADPNGTAAHDCCRTTGCLDLHHDLLVRMLDKLKRLDAGARAKIADQSAYVFRVAATELIELGRQQRSALGFPAKPTRADGTSGKVNDALAAFAEGPWLVRLFRIMRSYPFSLHHVPGRWPVTGLVEEKEKVHQRQVSAEEVTCDIALVLRVARETAGSRWVYANLTLPLMANGAPADLPPHEATQSPEHVDIALVSQLRVVYARHRDAGLSEDDAFRAASREVAGREAPRNSAVIRDAVQDLEAFHQIGKRHAGTTRRDERQSHSSARHRVRLCEG